MSEENESSRHVPEDRIAAFSSNLLDQGDSVIYATVGACFFLGAIFALGYSFWHVADAVFPISSLTPTKKICCGNYPIDLRSTACIDHNGSAWDSYPLP